MSVTDYRSFALEMIMLRAGILYTPDCEWSRVQIDSMQTAIRTPFFLALVISIIIVFIFIFISFTLCTLCANFILNK